MEVSSRTSMTTGSQAFLSTAATRSRRASCSGVNPLGILGANCLIIPIQVMAYDVALDGWRQLARKGFTGRERLPQLARGHVRRVRNTVDDPRRIQAGGRQVRRRGCLQAGSGDDHD